jgi:hypothetical protein
MPIFPEASGSTAAIASFEAGFLIDSAYQVELRSTLFGACDTESPYPIVNFLDGFGVPDTRNDDQPIPQDHGLVPSPQFLGGRNMTIGIAVQGDDEVEVVQRSANLMRAWSPVREYLDGAVTIPLCFTLDGSIVYRVIGKPLRAKLGYSTLLRTRTARQPFNDAALCEFLATDPRIYSNDLNTVSVAAGITTGGFPVPIGFPYAWPQGFGSSTPATVTATNTGNFPTYPVFRAQAATSISTPITIGNLTTGKTMTFVLSLTAGQYLEIDCGARTALLNGDPNQSRISAYDFKNSDWLVLEEGNNEIAWSVGASIGVGFLTVEWRDAWLL